MPIPADRALEHLRNLAVPGSLPLDHVQGPHAASVRPSGLDSSRGRGICAFSGHHCRRRVGHLPRPALDLGLMGPRRARGVLVQQVAQLEVKGSGLVGMGVVVWMLLIAAFGLMSEDITLASLVADPSQLVMVPLVAFGFSAFSTLVLLKLIRPPLASRVDITSSPTGDLRVDEK